jgi:Ca2+-binding EF-hand superfamily protein
MDARELQAAMKAMGVELTPDEARRMLASADRDGSGKLDFGEFAALVLGKLSGAAGSGSGGFGLGARPAPASSGLEKLSAAQLRSIKQVFEKFDADRSGQPHDACAPLHETDTLMTRPVAGTIDARELRAAMRAMQVELSPDEATALLRSVDMDGKQGLDQAVGQTQRTYRASRG